MMSSSMERALKLAAVTGLRAALGPALVARSQRRPERQHLALAALGELVIDKLPGVPGRDTLPSLLVRGVAGAWVAGRVIEEDGEPADPWAAPLGAAVAMGVAVMAPKLRRAVRWSTGIPQPILGLIEDYLALKLGTEAVGLSLCDATEAAKESLGDLRDRVQLPFDDSAGSWIPAQSTGAGSM